MLIGEPEQIRALQTKYASMRVEYARVLEENARLTETLERRQASVNQLLWSGSKKGLDEREALRAALNKLVRALTDFRTAVCIVSETVANRRKQAAAGRRLDAATAAAMRLLC